VGDDGSRARIDFPESSRQTLTSSSRAADDSSEYEGEAPPAKRKKASGKKARAKAGDVDRESEEEAATQARKPKGKKKGGKSRVDRSVRPLTTTCVYLPDDLWKTVETFLEPVEVANLAGVCTQLRDFSRQSVWAAALAAKWPKGVHLRRFPEPEQPAAAYCALYSPGGELCRFCYKPLADAKGGAAKALHFFQPAFYLPSDSFFRSYHFGGSYSSAAVVGGEPAAAATAGKAIKGKAAKGKAAKGKAAKEPKGKAKAVPGPSPATKEAMRLADMLAPPLPPAGSRGYHERAELCFTRGFAHKPAALDAGAGAGAGGGAPEAAVFMPRKAVKPKGAVASRFVALANSTWFLAKAVTDPRFGVAGTGQWVGVGLTSRWAAQQYAANAAEEAAGAGAGAGAGEGLSTNEVGGKTKKTGPWGGSPPGPSPPISVCVNCRTGKNKVVGTLNAAAREFGVDETNLLKYSATPIAEAGMRFNYFAGGNIVGSRHVLLPYVEALALAAYEGDREKMNKRSQSLKGAQADTTARKKAEKAERVRLGLDWMGHYMLQNPLGNLFPGTAEFVKWWRPPPGQELPKGWVLGEGRVRAGGAAAPPAEGGAAGPGPDGDVSENGDEDEEEEF